MSSVDFGLALVGALVKAAVRPAALDELVDVMVVTLQGADNILEGAQDGWSQEDEATLRATLIPAFDAIPEVSIARAEALAGGLAALVGLIVDAAQQNPKRKPRRGPAQVKTFFAKRLAGRSAQG